MTDQLNLEICKGNGYKKKKMKKVKITLKNFLRLTFFIVVVDLVIFVLFFNFFVTSTPIQDNNLVGGGDILEDIHQIAVNVSSQDYKLYTHDCTEFGEDLVKQLREINVSAYCVVGLYKEGTLKYAVHNWVEVILNQRRYVLEATSGEFITDFEYKEYYRPIKKGMCA